MANNVPSSPIEIEIDPIQPPPLEPRPNENNLYRSESQSYNSPLVRSLVYVSGGVLFVYLSQHLFSYIKPWIYSSKDEKKSVSELVNATFPFSYIPSSTPPEKLTVNFTHLESLIDSLREIDECKKAVYEDMLLNRVHRVITEKPSLQNREIHACLWLTLHCLLQLQNTNDHDINEWVLRIFNMDDLYEFLVLDKERNGTIASMRRQSTINFKYPIQLVWLSYAIASHLYSHYIMLRDTIRLRSGEKSQHFERKHLFLLENNRDLYEQIRFMPIQQKSAQQDISDENNDIYARNELRTKQKVPEAVTSLNSQVGMEMFEKFLRYTHLILMSDHSSVVKLALVCLGQIFATCNDITLRFLLTTPVLETAQIVEKLILCENEEVLLMLGKTLFTACIRDTQFLSYVIANSTTVNETIQIGIFSTIEALRVQYINLLYIMILRNENLTNQLVKSSSINLLAQICEMLIHPTININFVALQLVYGLCQYESLHSVVIGYHNESMKQTKHRQHSVVNLIKVTTFAPHASLRYYSLLIWDSLINPQRTDGIQTKSSQVYNNQNTRYLCKNEKLLDVFMLVLKDEQELAIKRTDVQILREICSRQQNDYERSVLINHFNLPFELIELLRYHVKYLYDQKGTPPESVKRYYYQVIALVASALLLLATLCDYDSATKQLVVHQFQISKYVQDFLMIIRKEKEPFYEQMAVRISDVAAHVFRDDGNAKSN